MMTDREWAKITRMQKKHMELKTAIILIALLNVREKTTNLRQSLDFNIKTTH